MLILALAFAFVEFLSCLLILVQRKLLLLCKCHPYIVAWSEKTAISPSEHHRVKQEKYISAYYNDVCSSSKQLNMRDMKIYNSRRLRLPVLSSSNASGPIVSLAEIQRGMRGAYTWSKFLEAANSVAGRLSIQLRAMAVWSLWRLHPRQKVLNLLSRAWQQCLSSGEEALGKPKSCYNLNLQAHNLSLKPPPRLLATETHKKSSNPLKHNGRRGLLDFLTGRCSPMQDREKVRDNPQFLHQSRNPKAGSIATSVARPSRRSKSYLQSRIPNHRVKVYVLINHT
ncbi:hypothetical protein O6H91_Y397100 [Diphasiastrum complanatum]|nr:hypothetical protein O6H91_Y397100 [Diphasiastrum complanatum]